MATILLQTAGAAIGSAFGPVGAMLGRAAGAIAGNFIDQRLFGKDDVVRGPTLEQAQILSSAEGSGIPRIYGRVRVGGQLVWATRHEAVTTRSRQGGGKGGAPSGPVVEETAYFANFAIAVCAGPVSRFGRIWADGKEIDRTLHEIRFHHGGEFQQPDPLIEAKQGAGNAPAMRGTAYAVFERFALEPFGNRIPQLTFEVTRSVAALDKDIRAMCIIPGATEAGLHPLPVKHSRPGKGTVTVNRHTLSNATDWDASIDELEALCPNLERAALVVSWFGSDLRAGECRVEPKVEHVSDGPQWSVSGLSRAAASQVSRVGGKPAYGGTPSDASVLAAIADLKARGLKVTFYPFLMMDIPASNDLPDPYGRERQPPHPWRGRIACNPAPGMSGSPDGTAAASAQVLAFMGNAAPSDFTIANGAVAYSGSEWTWRRMVLHYAHLAKAAGGVNAFVIGSEFRGLTTVRGASGSYPFVAALASLAEDVREVLGPQTTLTYAADWTEWFGHQPGGGSGDRLFHLDPLWAHPDIDAIGIDHYAPLTDWRADGDPVEGGIRSQSDPAYLLAGVSGGEGYDWYYATQADRQAGARTPITDSLGEPWIWRNKDLLSWWSNPHHNRIGGVRSAAPTAWEPQSKPFWITELGCPAVAMGANQPNVFPDRKSSESAAPRFSTGTRNDLVQNRLLAAHFAHWSTPAANPVSPAYGGRMIRLDAIHLWAWDARPYPAFPAMRGVWSDGAAWETGHWLNGRIGGCPLDDLLEAIGRDYGVTIEARCDGYVDGYVLPGPAPARAALEPLMSLHGLSATQSGERLLIRSDAYAPSLVIPHSSLVERPGGPVSRTREDESDLPGEASIVHADIMNGFESVDSYSRRLESGSRRIVTMRLPVVMPASTAIGIAEARLRDAWIGREAIAFELPARHADLSAGDLVSFDRDIPGIWRVTRLETGASIRVEARAVLPKEDAPAEVSLPAISDPAIPGAPELKVMNLPLPGEERAVRVAISADPWAGRYAIWSSPSSNSFTLRGTTVRRATAGKLLTALAPGPLGRLDHASMPRIALDHGLLAGVEALSLLNGANAAAIRCANGEWEIIQFGMATLGEDGNWVLGGLLRAQFGTDGAMLAGASAGSDFVLLDDAIERIGLTELEDGLTLNWRAGPASLPPASDDFTSVAHEHAALELRPWSPAHLQARREPAGIRLSWIRRSRSGGDGWDQPEAPMVEPTEAYRVAILDSEGSERRVIGAGASSIVYPAADEAADFGGPQSAIRFSVAQLGADGLPGTARSVVAPLV